MRDCMKQHKELYGDDEESDRALQEVATATEEQKAKEGKS